MMTTFAVIRWLVLIVLAVVAIPLWLKMGPSLNWKNWPAWKWLWDYRRSIGAGLAILIAGLLICFFWLQVLQFPWGWRTFLLGLVLLALASSGGLLGRMFLGLGALALVGSILFPLFREAGEAVEAREIAAAVAEAPRIEEFTVNAGEEYLSKSYTGPGTYHRVFSTGPWKLVHGHSGKVYDMSAGWSALRGTTNDGAVMIRNPGKETISFRLERIRP